MSAWERVGSEAAPSEQAWRTSQAKDEELLLQATGDGSSSIS